MASKGIDLYVYLNSSQPAALQYSHPMGGHTIGTQYTNPWYPIITPISFEMDSKDQSWFVGTFSWNALWNGNTVATADVSIDTVTGNITDGSLQNMMNTPSVVDPNNGWAVSYGFYDASTGETGDQTNRDQAYVYITAGMATWMGDLVAAHPNAAQQPFANFCLPGAHDCGMCDMTEVNNYMPLIQDVAGLAGPALGVVGTVSTWNLVVGALLALVLPALAPSMVPKAVRNIAFTQKDTISTMLNLGIRFFDFRPGYLWSFIPGADAGIYHQHSFIPGLSYTSFITQIVGWLVAHPTEIVVVNLNNQGFIAADQMTPPTTGSGTPANVLLPLLQPAIQLPQIPMGGTVLSQILAIGQGMINAASGAGLQLGGPSDLQTPIGELISSGKRLIFLNQISASGQSQGGWATASKYDSYAVNGNAYATLNPSTLIGPGGPLPQMTLPPPTNGAQNPDYTVLQLQATSTAIYQVDVTASATESDASSPLLGTKPLMDSQTYPWVLANAARQIPATTKSLLVLLNDFADNGLADVARQVSQQRMGLGWP